MATTTTQPRPSATPARVRRPRRRAPAIVEFYRSAIGKKWVMGITGVMLLGFVLFHMIGNVKLYLSKEELNLYGEALRDVPGHLLPRTWLLWTVRIALIGAFVGHIVAATQLTLLNRKARPQRYQSKRDYVAADYASRTMRWTGVIVLLFLIFHLMDLTWGNANSEFLRGDPYNNLIYSFRRPAVAAVYIFANIALAFHLYHGIWSMFQSMGVTNPKYNKARRTLAVAFASIILIGNVGFVVAVQAHWVELECPHTEPTTAACQS